MLKLKLRGLNVITFNKKLVVKGEIPGYTVEKQILQDKLCESSVAIFPTAKYDVDDDKFSAICTELSCNKDRLVAIESTDELIEYIEVNKEKFTVKELYDKYKDNCKVIYSCDLNNIKTTKDKLQSIVKCNSEYGCDYCMYKSGRYYTFDLDSFKVRIEVLNDGTSNDKDRELRLYIVTPELMEEIRKYEEG